jgi:beta-lactamase regulating signal transducer with metallopeptidase domain
MLGILVGATLRTLLLAVVVGTALRLWRTCSPRVSLAAWSLVLAASLSMPVATRLASIVLPHGIFQVSKLSLTQDIVIRANVASMVSRAQQGVSTALKVAPDWYSLALFLYLAVLSALMLRLLMGFLLSYRIVRRATPIREDWLGDYDVRVSRHIGAPATFGSVILLPSDHTAWTAAKRLAVLAHEGSHVTRCDFAVQLAAAVNHMVFWFNPFTWWLQRHLSYLAEAASDDAAIAGLDDRFGYAQILLEFSGGAPGVPGTVEMARGPAVALRIERILSETPLPAGISHRGRAIMAACIVPLTILLSSIIVFPAPPLEREIPSVVNVADNEVAATGARKPALPTPVSTEAVAGAMLAGQPPAPDPKAQISLQLPALAPARLSAPPLRTFTRGPSRRASHSMNTNKLTAPTPWQPVASAITPLSSTAALNLATAGAGEDGQPPFFERLANKTCGATDLLGLGPAYPIFRGGSAYLANAHFFRSRDGRPWVTLNYTGGQVASLPVMIKGGEIEFTRSRDLIYTLSPSHNNHLVNFATHSNAGAVDFTCRGENPHPL